MACSVMLINNKAQEKFCPDREVIHLSKAAEHLRGWQREKKRTFLSECKQGSRTDLLGTVSHYHRKEVLDFGE